jgi:hypothetical protein
MATMMACPALISNAEIKAIRSRTLILVRSIDHVIELQYALFLDREVGARVTLREES